ncbi:unnamed protein product [Rhodiola kirilowii]
MSFNCTKEAMFIDSTKQLIWLQSKKTNNVNNQEIHCASVVLNHIAVALNILRKK